MARLVEVKGFVNSESAQVSPRSESAQGGRKRGNAAHSKRFAQFHAPRDCEVAKRLECGEFRRFGIGSSLSNHPALSRRYATVFFCYSLQAMNGLPTIMGRYATERRARRSAKH